MGTSIINLEVDFRGGGVSCLNLHHPWIESPGLSRNRVFGRVRRPVSTRTRISDNGKEAGGKTYVYMISSLKTSWSPAIKNSGGSPPK